MGHQNKEEERLKDKILMDKMSKLRNFHHKDHSLLGILKNKFSHNHHFHKPDINFQNLSQKEQKKRVYVALEKLNHACPEKFSDSEKKILQHSNMGQIQIVYQTGLKAAFSLYVFMTICNRNYSVSNLTKLLGTGILMKYVLEPFPNYFKEELRYKKGLKLAENYLKTHDIMKFQQILDPLITHHELEHILD